MKNNRAGSYSIMAAAFIASLFLSLLCSLFYNFWLDNIEGIKKEDGDWHGRITGEISEDNLAVIHLFANVEKAVINEDLSGEQGTVVDVYFYDKRTVYHDMSAIINALGLTENAADYNYQLLSLYFIRIPKDQMPRLLMPAYLAIVALVCFSLILVIHNSFAVSQNHRIRQFGIFSSIGATPGQIRVCLVQEALMLSFLPILMGLLLGIALSFGVVRAMGVFAVNLVGGRRMPFKLHPIILALILLLSFLTVLISAWLPARKLSRLTPLEAIRGMGELQLKKRKGIPLKKHSPVLAALFGMEGELAGNALRAQKKALRTTSLSLTISFLGFMLMQCFFTLSGISTNHTYFEAYQDVWDVMAVVKDTRIEDFALTKELRGLPGCSSSVVYQKAEAVCILPEECISMELEALGGLEAVAGAFEADGEGFFCIKAPMVILDDEGFGEFCGQIGIAPRFDGTIVLNRFWDSLHSNFRYREYLPYVREDMGEVTLQNAGHAGEEESGFRAEIPVLAYTQECPALREEYDDYALVQFIPLSLWSKISGQIGGAEREVYIRMLADNRESPESLEAMEEGVVQIIGREYEMESENRIQERIDNDKMIKGYELILGAFCVLLAIIGIAHVFSHTLGFLCQRKREFARYMSVGVTPEGMRKIFCIEALVTVAGPVLITLALTVTAAAFMIKASYLDPVEFIRVAPIMPILAFILAVFGFVALAYYLGGKQILTSSLKVADAERCAD